MAEIGEIDWSKARAALDEAAGKLAALLRTVPDPAAPALGQWSIAELAAHVTHAFDVVPALARQARSFPLAELQGLAAETMAWVANDAERDLGVLAQRIEDRAGAFLEATEASAPDEPAPWLVDGTTGSLAVLTCHLLNETVVHGYDIAKASGQPWPIDRTAAALIFEGFFLPVFRIVDPRAFVIQERVAGVRACFDIRLRGAGRFFLVFADGAMTVEAPSGRPVDCHMSADPAAFLLVAWGRISQWRAIPRGQLLAWGRRPWMGLRMRGFVRTL